MARHFFPEERMRANKFYAVVHAASAGQVERNVAVAFEYGADGVFLINHHISVFELLVIYTRVRIAWPAAYIGLNLLGVPQVEAIRRIPGDASALWIDDGGIRPKQPHGYSTAMAELIRQQLRLRGFQGEYYGGVAFKTQVFGDGHPNFAVINYQHAASKALGYMDVVTTSGPATGAPPKLEKIKAMRRGVGPNGQLANASGMTAGNVGPYLDYVDRFLVASGVSADFENFDPRLVRDFADQMQHRV